MTSNLNINASLRRNSIHSPFPIHTPKFSHIYRLPDRRRSPRILFTPTSPLLTEWRRGSSRDVITPSAKGLSAKGVDRDDELVPAQGYDALKILRSANSVLPHVVLGSTVLALAYPPSFTWFTTSYYAPALGFLMFAVGVNSRAPMTLQAVKRPWVISAGYVGQFIIKPLLGYIFGSVSVIVFHLPNSIGAGIMLTSCVSGAQLSNYATFLTDPQLAPLSIVMTSLSTATAVLVTPTLSLLLIGKRLPVDVIAMMSSIVQIVVAPITAGLLLNRFIPRICAAIQPLLPPLSVFVTALCVGSPLAMNMKSIISPLGVTASLLIFGFHASSFIAGYILTGKVFRKTPEVEALQRVISFETGMQSSLLALTMANNFFQDPLVGVPPAISVVIMSLMGFFLVMVWSKKRKQDSTVQ